ncbi:twin-arginine translocase TatA/TatE family subunit [Rurimicrobium arvi]|uniref:Sec-independent protein translocase protein TatA n=1 Tax=Rurimicrobium arvi TaxID=2049916 RepID=A0ABP8MWY4_9BACT
MYTAKLAHLTQLISMPGGSEMLVILLVVLVLFGGRKIPELARGLGRGVKEFKDAKDGAAGNTDQRGETE